MKSWLRVVCALAFAVAATAAAPTPALAAEIHGETDVFKGRGIALAWAVARGPDEARTFIVVRVVTEPEIRAVSVTGRDPFTKAEQLVVAPQVTKGRIDIRIPRASFADFPRTHWMFFTDGKDPSVVVYYLGVPDTTPEFVDAAKLDAYLDGRVGKAR